jgi:ribosome-binding ATPase YchF (GTP1/OBG family)
MSGQLLNAIAANDALLLVVRAFEDDLVAHAYDTVHAERDLSVMETELILIDMTVVDRGWSAWPGATGGTTGTSAWLEESSCAD